MVRKWNANTKKPLGLCQNGGLYPEMKKITSVIVSFTDDDAKLKAVA